MVGKNGQSIISKLLVVFICLCSLNVTQGNRISLAAPTAAAPSTLIINPLMATVTHDPKPSVKLIAPSGSTVILYDGDVEVGRGTGQGAIPVIITLSTALSDGAHSLKVVTDGTEVNTLPALIVDSSEPFDIEDIVKTVAVAQKPLSLTVNNGGSGSSDPMTPEELNKWIKHSMQFFLKSTDPSAGFMESADALSLTVNPGSSAGSTALFYSSNAEYYYIKIAAAPLPVPKPQSSLPANAKMYEAGSNIVGVDAATNKYVGLYRTDLYGKVTGFKQVTLTSADIMTVSDLVKAQISLIGAANSNLGHFQVLFTNGNGTALTKDDFTVSIKLAGTVYPITAFSYAAATGTIMLDPTVVTAYNREPIELTIAASAISAKLSGGKVLTTAMGNILGYVRGPNGVGVSGVELKFRSGNDNRTGSIAAVTTTASDGSYAIPLEPGVYTVEMRDVSLTPVYSSGYLTRTLAIDRYQSNNNNLTITPIPVGQDIKVVLTWGTAPPDLDSYLTGPADPDTGRFLINYANRQYTVSDVVYADLDTDNTTGGGPEITTLRSVAQQVYGTYSYYVRQYSSTHLGTLQASTAKVEVYKGSSATPYKTYAVPTIGGGETRWDVFDMVINADGVTFVDKNTLVSEVLLGDVRVLDIGSTTISGLTGASNTRIKVGLRNKSHTGLTTSDFTVSAKFYNLTTSAYVYAPLSRLEYNPSTRMISFEPIQAPAGWNHAQMIIDVSPASGSILLTGSGAQAIVDISNR